jgi:hypothetical protein
VIFTTLVAAGTAAGAPGVYSNSLSTDFSSDSPLQTIERLHKAMRDADPATINALLHAEYHGLSLGGPPDHRRVYTDTRAKAIADIAKLKPGAWEIRLLRTTTQTDSNGMAHVWARYVFLFNGAPDHCGFESYGLFRSRGGWQVISFADTDNPLDGRSPDAVCPDVAAPAAAQTDPDGSGAPRV